MTIQNTNDVANRIYRDITRRYGDTVAKYMGFVGVNDSGITAYGSILRRLLAEGLERDSITSLWLVRRGSRVEMLGIMKPYDDLSGARGVRLSPDATVRQLAKSVGGKRVVMLGDDSVTTGRTLSEAKRFLNANQDRLKFGEIYTTALVSSSEGAQLLDSPTIVLPDNISTPYNEVERVAFA